jgi:hypothetical protein
MAVWRQIPGQVMIFYSWTALTDSEWMERRESSHGWADSSAAMGITDDRGRAMQAGAETLVSGRAGVVLIEAVRPAMAGHTLASCYLRTGVGWVGRRTLRGDVTWHRFFRRGTPGSTVPADPVRLFDPASDAGSGDSEDPSQQPPGRMEP